MKIGTKIVGIMLGAAVCVSMIPGCAAEQAADEGGEQAADEETNGVQIDAQEGTSNLTPQGLAPDCIHKTLVTPRLLNLSSSCSTNQSVRVIIHLGPDSECFTIRPNQSGVNVSWSWPSTFDRLDSC